MQDRYGCLNHHRRITCINNRTIRRPVIEERALSGLTERLVSPEAVAGAARAYHEELNRRKQDRRAQTSADRQALAKIERAIASIIAAIEDGMYQPVMKVRLADLETQKAEIEARLTSNDPPLPDVNPNIADIYRRKIARLPESLSDPQTNQEAAMALRSLIDEIVLTPGEKRGEIHATLRGELMSILEFASGRNTPGTFPSRVITNAAPSPRNHLHLGWFTGCLADTIQNNSVKTRHYLVSGGHPLRQLALFPGALQRAGAARLAGDSRVRGDGRSVAGSPHPLTSP